MITPLPKASVDLVSGIRRGMANFLLVFAVPLAAGAAAPDPDAPRLIDRLAFISASLPGTGLFLGSDIAGEGGGDGAG